MSKAKVNLKKNVFVSKLRNFKVPDVATLLLLIASLSLFSFYTGYTLSKQNSPAFDYNPPEVIRNVEFPYPTELEIPDLNIKLPIEQAEIIKGEWQVSEKNASHLAISGNPGENTNMVIYGHNKFNVLAKLKNAKKGSIISIKNTKGIVYKYIIKEISIVQPTELEVVMPTQTEILTLFTCTGFADSKRLVVRAIPSDTIGFEMK